MWEWLFSPSSATCLSALTNSLLQNTKFCSDDRDKATELGLARP
jgi:hypothetical protein